MKSKFFGINAKMALAALAVCGLFTSCYEKDELDAPVVAEPVYVITGNLVSASTGMAVSGSITIGTETVSVTDNGYFEKKVSAAGSYTITVDLDGYLKATRTVYLAAVGKGQTSVANADITLYDASTQVVAPEEEEVVGDKATAEKAEATIKAAATKLFSDATVAGGKVGAVEVTTLNDGTTQVIVPVTLDSKAGEPVTVDYFAMEGFSYTILPTKALSPNDIWVASAEKALNRKAGITLVKRTQTISAPAGYSVEGYKLTYIMENKSLTFNSLEGLASYQKNLTIFPTWYSHDSHDSHDGHGVTPGAGGGSSANN